MNPLKTILPAPSSPAVDHRSLIYTPNGLFFNPPNAPEPIFIPPYHPATLNDHMQSLLQNLVKLGQVSTEKGKGTMASTYECFNTMEDTNDENEDQEANTADLEADTADVMLMENMQEFHMNVTSPVYDSDDSEDPFVELNKGLILLTKRFSQYKNSKSQTSSNPRNQAIKQGERVVIQGRNAQRFVGNGENTADVGNNGNEDKVLDKQDDSSRLGNDTDIDSVDIRPTYDSEPNFAKEQMVEEVVIPIYDTEPNFDKEQMVEVQSTVDHIMPTNEKQQCKQPNFSNEGEVDQNVVQCLEKHSESESLPDNLMTETSNQTLESENILLKKTIAQFHKDFSKLEAHCISLELKLQNESLTSGNNGQFLNEQSKRVDTLVKEMSF